MKVARLSADSLYYTQPLSQGSCTWNHTFSSECSMMYLSVLYIIFFCSSTSDFSNAMQLLLSHWYSVMLIYIKANLNCVILSRLFFSDNQRWKVTISTLVTASQFFKTLYFFWRAESQLIDQQKIICRQLLCFQLPGCHLSSHKTIRVFILYLCRFLVINQRTE